MNNIIVDKSEDFAVKIVGLYKMLTARNEYVMSKQLLKAGTSIGANVSEAQRGQSNSDFGAKMNIALKESSETLYWLKILYRTDYLSQAEYDNYYKPAHELLSILTKIVKTTFKNMDS